jgi:hypothetical protein
MPAMGIPWWLEAYRSGAASFFGMPVEEEGSLLKQVVGGVYDEEALGIVDFKTTLSVEENCYDDLQQERTLHYGNRRKRE